MPASELPILAMAMIIRVLLAPESFRPLSPRAWVIDLPPKIPPGDVTGISYRSPLRLFEAGREMGTPHALHQDILALGGGRYSHWGQSLYLSTEDNSNPRHNGRAYSIEYDSTAVTDTTALKEAVEYCMTVARGHLGLPRSRGMDMNGRTVLELGPGDTLGEPLLLASAGARMIVADRFVARWDEERRPFYQMLRDQWDGPTAPLDRVLAQGSFEGVMTVLAEPAECLAGIADGQVELALSNAVLEHLYDLEAAAGELWRVSAPGAWHFHQIDLRDHKDFERPLEYLLYDAETYRKIQDHNQYERGCQWRASEFRAAFEARGFEVVELDINGRAEDAYLADLRPRLHAAASRYAHWPSEDLMITGARFVLRRSA
ncbi:hypothetical protein MTBSS4_250022 [Magnetospirillum sp. SS-4]|nr:hypothetical protein MTBSS4_250022 [Magnetospirillum sp. SS-4]